MLERRQQKTATRSNLITDHIADCDRRTDRRTDTTSELHCVEDRFVSVVGHERDGCSSCIAVAATMWEVSSMLGCDI